MVEAVKSGSIKAVATEMPFIKSVAANKSPASAVLP
jgi:hypothetical protein